MAMADLKLKDLRYLSALASTRHFGRAAAACFVSQPTLSAQLRELEAYLGVQLIERQPRHVTLTEAGSAIAARARQIIATSDEIVRLAQAWRDPLAGRLRVATLPTVGPYLLPQLMVQIRQSLPRLDLMLYEYQTGPMLEQLRAGEIDLGILALPVDLDGLESRALYAEPFVLAVPESHRLAARRQVQAHQHRGRKKAKLMGRSHTEAPLIERGGCPSLFIANACGLGRTYPAFSCGVSYRLLMKYQCFALVRSQSVVGPSINCAPRP